MKITKRIISLFLIITMTMSAAVFAADESENIWTVVNQNNGTVSFGEDGRSVTLECSTTKKVRAVAEALSPALENGSEDHNINLNFTASFENFDANKRATVTLVSGEYSAELFNFTGTDSGITISFAGASSADKSISSSEPIQFNVVFNVLTKNIRIISDYEELFSGTYELLGNLDINSLNVSYKSIFTTSLNSSSTVIFENASLTPGLYAEISADSDVYVVGVPAVISLSLPESGWERVEMYANDTLVAELPFGTTTYEFAPISAGTYIIKAIVYDEFGNNAAAELELVYEKNEAPVISIEGIPDGADITLKTTDIKQFVINASDSDGSVDRVEIYRYGELVETVYEVPYTGNLDELGICMGVNPYKAVVYDDFGVSTSVSMSVLLTKYSSVPFFSECDFLRSGSTYGSGMSIATQRGFAKEEVVDEAFGNSLLIGGDENMNTTDFTGGQYTFIQSSMNNNYTLYTLDFDLNVVEPSERNGLAMFGIRRSNGIVANIMSVDKTQLNFGSVKADYLPGWNHVSVTLSREIGNQYYSVELNDEVILTKAPIDLSDAPTNYRFYTTSDPANIGTVAVDNIEYKGLVASPRIIGVGTHSEIVNSKISCDTNELGIFLSGNMVREDLIGNNVHLYVGDAPVDVELLRYNSETLCIEMTTSENLAPNTEYRIILDENVHFTEADELGLPMEYRFTTDHKGLTVDVVELSRDKDSLKINTVFSNLDSASKDVYIFVTFFDEGRIVNTKVLTATLSADNDENNFTFDIPSWSGATPYIFVSDGILFDRIYYAKKYSVDDINEQAPVMEPVAEVLE